MNCPNCNHEATFVLRKVYSAVAEMEVWKCFTIGCFVHDFSTTEMD